MSSLNYSYYEGDRSDLCTDKTFTNAFGAHFNDNTFFYFTLQLQASNEDTSRVQDVK